MTETEKALCRLLGGSVLELGAETDKPVADKLLALAAELPELRTKAARADQLALEAESTKKKTLLDRMIAENRITAGEVEGLSKLDYAWLAAELPKRSANAVAGDPLPGVRKESEPEITDGEKKIAGSLGLTAEEYLKSKKECK